ncbi:S41 family peptidase [Sphingobacterium deserti]|uniref:Peptidase S41 n=1 Tax=Sphingobacterium deserti TaxID=1229276 RepID=A0A0B8T0Y3_9SPHI|nr:S41 family peptidase [Sphingobacterium deserti]KGE14472.1 peptidase S41 [Sphingobacterium deserti]
MKLKDLFFGVVLLCNALLGYTSSVAQEKETLTVNHNEIKRTIRMGKPYVAQYYFFKDSVYQISVEQQGIDVSLTLKDSNGKSLAEKDSPNGRFGFEKLVYSPDSSAYYTLCVTPLDEKENAKVGSVRLHTSNIPDTLTRFTKEALEADFTMLRDAYLETRLGLWYHTFAEFDSLYRAQRAMIVDGMTALDFYKVVAPFTAQTREGHASIRLSDETNNYFRQYGTYLPLLVKISNGKLYILESSDSTWKGNEITAINGRSTKTILQMMFDIEPADGYNVTSKARWVEDLFSSYLLRLYGLCDTYTIEIKKTEPETAVSVKIAAVSSKVYSKMRNAFRKANPQLFFTQSLQIDLDSLSSCARLTINDFGANRYAKGMVGFKNTMDSVFRSINNLGINNLIIDLRKNEGGTQGMEDILMSYLIDKRYKKYQYVEVPSDRFSFTAMTDYIGEDSLLQAKISREFFRDVDGRFVNRPGTYEGLSPSPWRFSGRIFILIGGLTFSGGSEFAALAKNHTSAVFVGEETGGGYYGNSSGYFLNFTLPHSGLSGRIPLIKFVVNTSNKGVPFGRGLIPDYEIIPTIGDYLKDDDPVLRQVERLISNAQN